MDDTPFGAPGRSVNVLYRETKDSVELFTLKLSWACAAGSEIYSASRSRYHLRRVITVGAGLVLEAEISVRRRKDRQIGYSVADS